MTAGDWANTSHIELGHNTNLTFSGMDCIASLDWYLVVASGLRVYLPTGTPFKFVADATQSIESQLAAAVQALANDQGVPAMLPDGTTVMPASQPLSGGTLS